MTKKGQHQEAVVTEVSRVDLLEAFAELVAERFGYFMARRLTQEEMNEKCEKEIEASRKQSGAVRDAIEGLIKNPSTETQSVVVSGREELTRLQKIAKEKKEPFMDKISPLAKAQRWMDSVAIPDSLKEIGHAITPHFTLSEHVTKALEAQKHKKKQSNA